MGAGAVVAEVGFPVRPRVVRAAGGFQLVGEVEVGQWVFGVALEHTIRYQRVFAEGERYELERSQDHVHVRYVPWGPPRPS